MREFLVALGIIGCGRIDFDPRSDGSVSGDAALACVADFTAYGDQICVRRGDKTVWCWGDNMSGALGTGSYVSHATPMPSLMTNAIALSSGEQHVCAIDSQRKLWCWGYGIDGQLGNGGTADSPVPVPVTLPADVVEVRASQFNTCARLADGTGWCWGHNQNEQLGYVGPPSPVPVQVPALANATTFTTGDNYVCVLRPNRTVECWGKNDAGELGDGTRTPPSRGAAMPIIAVTDPVIGLSAGCHRHTCLVTETGQVWCWGENALGAVTGGQPSAYEPTPIRVLGLPGDVVQVTVGAVHSCARTRTHQVWCWGSNALGALGVGDTAARFVPVRTQFIGTARDLQLSCGKTYVLTDTGLVGWGEEPLGNGAQGPTPSPVPIGVPCP